MAKFKEIIVKSIDVESGNYLSITDETKNITALDIYLVPKEGGEHERYVVDNNGLISKQSAGKKILPLYESEGINDNVSPFVSLSIDKDNGVSFYQHDSFINWFNQDSIFNFGRSGIDFIYRQSADNEGDSRNGRFNINTGGNVFIGTTKSSDRYSNHAYITLNPDTNSIKNTFYEGSLGQEKFIEFSIDGIKTNTLSNADGDLSFTNHVVIKDDGTFGYEPKRSSTPTLYPKVDIIDYTQDATNYYLRVTVSNMVMLGFLGNPYFNVAIGQGSTNIVAVNMSASYGFSWTNTDSPFTLGGFHFTLTIPKASNTHPWWNDDTIMITATWLGNDNADGGSASIYNPRRIGNDTKKIGDVKIKSQPFYPKILITEYTEDATHYLMKVTINNIDDSSTSLGNDMFNISTGGATALIDAVGIESTINGAIEYASSPAPGVGQYNRLWGFSFNVKFPKASNTSPFWSNDDAAITVVYKGKDLLDGGANSPYKPRRYDSDTKLIRNVRPNVKKKDITLPNAQGDATYTRQLVQKNDGTIGYEPKSLPASVFKYPTATGGNTGISSFYRVDYPLYFTPSIGREAIELVPYDRFNAPNNNNFGASGERSTAIGYGSRAVGMSSVAIGGGTATGQEGIAIGRGTAGFQSVSIQSIDSVDNGGSNTMIGTYNASIGTNSRIAIIGGSNHTVTNAYSQSSVILGGSGHTVNGALQSTLLGGANNTATSEFETIMGCMATIGVGQGGTYWVPTDRLFTIGNGGENTSATRSDAFQILKNGYTTVPSQTPALFKNGGAKGVATKEAVELFNSSTGYTSNAELNAAFPNVIKGYEVYRDGDEVMYKKVTDTKWATIQINLLS